MRIYYDSMTLPKKAARRIQKFYSKPSPLSDPMPLYEAQARVALLLGYDSWHELEQVTKSQSNPPSLLDEDAGKETQEARIQFQSSVWRTIVPFTMPVCREMAFRFRVSAKNPKSEGFLVDLYRTHNMFYDEEFEEWRFIASLRSQETRNLLYDADEMPCGTFIEQARYIDRLLQLCEDAHSEQFAQYTSLFWALFRAGTPESFLSNLPEFDKRVSAVFPDDFPTSQKTLKPLEWYQIEHRDFLRSLYALGAAYYVAGDYKTSRKWLLTCKRCCSITLGSEDEYLEAIRSGNPDPKLHLALEGNW